jgi:YVTN family beta-propeller protein
VVDIDTNRLIHYVPVPLGPRGLAMAPDGRKLYIGSQEVSSVSVLDTASDRVVSEIDVGRSPTWLVLSPDGRSLVVSVSETNEVAIIDTATDRVAGHISVSRPDASAISPDGRTAYVASTSLDGAALVVIDLVKRVPVGRVALAGSAGALSFGLDGQHLYFAVAGGDSIEVLDTRRNEIVAAVDAGAPYGSVSAGTAFGQLVLSGGRRALVLIDPARNSVGAVVDVGMTPVAVATGADRRTVYVTAQGSGNVLVVDLVDRQIRGRIRIDDLGATPRQIAVQPGPPHATSHPNGGAVNYRDVSRDDAPQLSGSAAGGAGTPPARLAQRDGPSVCNYPNGTALNPGGYPCGTPPWTSQGGIPL